jgi:transcriptional/translational regulatory protein YebC/TACO1
MELKEWQKDVKERKALISDELESFELSLIEVDGVLDVKREDDVVEVFTTPKSVGRVAKSISEDLNYVVDSYEIIQIPKTPLSVDEVVRQKVDEVIELLEDHEDVQTVWANVSLA